MEITRRNLKASTRARSVRVAYLVEEEDANADYVLDAIFAESYSRWGGRFTLVVPCVRGAIDQRYARWLEVYDADIIYSYVDLPAETVRLLHERYYPSFLVRHEPPGAIDDPKRAAQPRLPVDPLTVFASTSLPTSLPMRTRQGPQLLVDMWFHLEDRFVRESFGTFAASFHRWPLPEGLRDRLKSLRAFAWTGAPSRRRRPAIARPAPW